MEKAQPMSTGTITSPNSAAPENLKQIYEAALGELRGEESADRKANTPIYPQTLLREVRREESADRKANTPIYRRKQEVAASTDASPAQPNRALDEAADALAALWKTSSKECTRPKDQPPVGRTQKLR